MKPRTPEASRLEDDYLRRVRVSLQQRSPAEVEEILQSLSAHIEEELSAGPDGAVTLVQMATVLEQLGAPDAYAQEESAPPSYPPPIQPAATVPPSSPAGLSRLQFADLLDKIWIAYLIGVVGLFVPVIELHFCSILCSILLAVVLLRLPSGSSGELRSAGGFALADALLLVAISGLSLLSLAHPLLGLPLVPVGVAEMVCTLVAYWMIMGRTAVAVADSGGHDVARRVYSARIFYVVFNIVMVMLMLLIAVVAALAFHVKDGNELWWLGFAVLPLQWIFGGLFILSPLGRARQALRG